MIAVNFDTLNFMDELKRSGMDQKQAEAITKATAAAFSQMMQAQELATKKDIRESETSIKNKIDEIEMQMYKFIVKATMTTIALLGSINTLFHYFPK